MRARSGWHANLAAVWATYYTYIYGVTKAHKKSQGAAFPGSQHAEFFQAHAPLHTYARNIYIWSVECRVPAAGVRYAVQKQSGQDGSMHREAFSYLRRRPHFKKLQIFVQSRRLCGNRVVFHLSRMAGVVPGGPAKRIHGSLRVLPAVTPACILAFWLHISVN